MRVRLNVSGRWGRYLALAGVAFAGCATASRGPETTGRTPVAPAARAREGVDDVLAPARRDRLDRAGQDDATLRHVLARLTFGARVDDFSAARQVGLSAWLERQLDPDSIDDTKALARVAGLRTLNLDTAELRAKYEVPPNVRQALQKEAANAPVGGPPNLADLDPRERRETFERLRGRFPELSRLEGNPRQVVDELQQAKVMRALFSERQLNEILVDFWFNHFNVYARKGPIEFMVNEYEREAIRPHALGRFEDLLLATARSPAMLFYLDNWQSAEGGRKSSGSPRDRRRSRGQAPSGREKEENAMPATRPGGLNENYARELMELHTLGVDGGYTQADVVSVARAFTGWTIRGDGPFGGGVRRGGAPSYWFDERRHARGDKRVLGVTIKEGGEEEGRAIIALLAKHPSTARFIATKLARRFVADDPPKALVERAAATFLGTGGDIRSVLRTILYSDEFLSPHVRGAKIKTPFEFVVSALRVTGGSVQSAAGLARRIADMGMPLYLQQPPTGYADLATEWISTASLLARMNFGLDLAAGRVEGVRLKAVSSATGTFAERLDLVAARLVPSGLTPTSRETLLAEAKRDPRDSHVEGLVLGSPDFQRR
jgi:uncharacterized protein (DUF1800 family)